MTTPKQVALHDVAVIERDIVNPTAIETGTLYVGLENIQTGGRFVGVRPVDAGELASSKFAFTPQHLLYGKLRPYLAKIARPDFEGICSTDILPILPGPDLDHSYLAWLLLTPQMVALASSRATGANLPRLSPSALAELKITLPPIRDAAADCGDPGRSGRAAGQAPRRPRATRDADPIHLPRYVRRPRYESEGVASGVAWRVCRDHYGLSLSQRGVRRKQAFASSMPWRKYFAGQNRLVGSRSLAGKQVGAICGVQPQDR